MPKQIKYETCMAKTTVPKGMMSKIVFLKPDTWYPIRKLKASAFGEGDPIFEFLSPSGNWVYTHKLNSSHLQGGNFKVRRVKDAKA